MFLWYAHLANCILIFSIEHELGAGINPRMSLTPFISSVLDETRFEPTTFRVSY